MSNSYKKESCRLCASKNLSDVLVLNQSPLCDAYSMRPKQQEFYDLTLCLCNNCNFVQINTVINPEEIYRDYIYVTTSSLGLQKHFENFASQVVDYLNLNKSNFVVDIGSNDGTLLSFFKKNGLRVLGIEPSIRASNFANENNIETLPEFLSNEISDQVVEKYGKASLITINNLFANVDYLKEFVESAEILLSDEGVIVIESSYLIDMIDNMIFDFIYHEHLSYFSIVPLVKFFNNFNFRLINVHRVGTKGGSLRYYWARNGSKWKIDKSVLEMTSRELSAEIGPEKFTQYNNKINTVKLQLRNFLEKHKDGKIVGYGASATSTTLISHLGLEDYLTYLVDDNPDKVGTFSPGYNLPVYSSEKILLESPDVIIILAWRFKEEILKKIPNDFDGEIVVPLPNFHIENNNGN